MHAMPISLSCTCISIQPTDKAVEYLINSYKLLLLLVKRKERDGGGGGGDQSESQEDWAELNGWRERERRGGGGELLNTNGDAFKRRRKTQTNV